MKKIECIGYHEAWLVQFPEAMCRQIVPSNMFEAKNVGLVPESGRYNACKDEEK